MGKFLEGCFDDLSLYVRHSAWLNATPERPKHDKSEAPRLSRIEQQRKEREDEDYQPEMPPLDRAAFLVGFLFDAGPVVNTGMGAVPLTSSDLLAWQEETGIELRPWQARFLRRLSKDYINELHLAEKRDREAPWSAIDAKPEVSDAQAALRALAKL